MEPPGAIASAAGITIFIPISWMGKMRAALLFCLLGTAAAACKTRGPTSDGSPDGVVPPPADGQVTEATSGSGGTGGAGAAGDDGGSQAGLIPLPDGGTLR